MVQDNRIAHLITQLGELRELLLVIDRSGDAVPNILLKLAREKAEGISDTARQLRSPEFWEEMSRQDPFASVDAPVEDETPVASVDDVVEESEPVEEMEVEVAPEAEEEIVPEVEPEPEPEPEEEEELYPWEQVGYEEPATPQVSVDEEEEIVEEEIDELDYEQPELYDELEVEEPEDELPETVTLEEALQRKQAKELRKALSLNDRFRFRRELFGNSDIRMNETLALIDAMGSYDEAEDYIFNDLGWDIEVPEVAEFMNIVQKHFL